MLQICKNLFLSIIGLSIIFSIASTSKATTAVLLSDTDLIASSRFIITGEVRSVVSAWDDAHRIAWTYVEVECDRVLKGNLINSRIVLKQLGGDFADSGFQVFGAPKFQSGQRVLLYLNTATDGSLHVAHSFMGKFSIEADETDQQMVVHRTIQEDEVTLLLPVDETKTTNQAGLRDYLRMIRRTLERETGLVAHYDTIHNQQPLTLEPIEYERKKREGVTYSPDFNLSASGVRWMEPDAGQPVNYYLNSDRSPVAGGGTAEVTRGLNAWSAQSGANIRLQLAGSTTHCGYENDGTNTISFGDCLNQLSPPVGCSGVVAQTATVWVFDGRVINGRSFNRIIETDITFNDGLNCFLGNPANVAEIACHELGHSIGLGHSDDPAAIMWSVARGGRDASLAADDIAGVLAIYPPSTGGGGGGGTTNNANVVSQNVPTSMNPNQSYPVSITMRNTGTATWDTNYRLVSQTATNWGISSIRVSSNVAPSASVTFSFNVTAPAQSGTYNFQWMMSQDNIGVFGSPTATLSIAVGISGGGGGGGETVSIVNLSLSDGFVGTAYKQTLTATGGTAPYQWQMVSGSLPLGVGFSSNGVIEGIPLRTGIYTAVIQVYDFSGNLSHTDTKRYTFTIFNQNEGGANIPVITRIKIKGVKKFFVYGQNFTATSQIIVNGVLLQPKSFEIDGSTGSLFYKGKLTFLNDGINVVQIIEGANRSSPFYF